jgi:hypothetical protein
MKRLAKRFKTSNSLNVERGKLNSITKTSYNSVDVA